MSAQSFGLDLFESTPIGQPLAARLRPQSLTEYVGQAHLVASGKVLHDCVQHQRLHSMILWGPPGSGKTTLAHILAQAIDAQVEVLSAVTAGVKDVRSVVARAQIRQQQGEQTVLFVDEVHRFSKAQQDAFLPHVESGLLTFIGATTENPSFEVNRALLSRTRVHVLKPLQQADLLQLLERALQEVGCQMSEPDQHRLVALSQGDARRLLNSVEVLAEHVAAGDACVIDLQAMQDALGQVMAQYDKGGDVFYDQISAFHKSVRGSSVDGALYWMARMIHGGCDPLYIARRLLAIATEDIGLADPRAMQVTLNAWEIFERVGEAEGNRAIAQAAVYCALAPKSNALYSAYQHAVEAATQTADQPVPEHLRNAPTQLMKELGFGKAYRYSHDEPHAVSAGQTYLPESVTGDFYHPAERGLEEKLQAKLAWLAQLNQAT
jgi:putative ATPase